MAVVCCATGPAASSGRVALLSCVSERQARVLPVHRAVGEEAPHDGRVPVAGHPHERSLVGAGEGPRGVGAGFEEE